MTQKIIKVGNSYGVILPKEVLEQYNLSVGQEVEIDTNVLPHAFVVRSEKYKNTSQITPEFKNWLDNFSKEHTELLQELAKTV